MTTADAIAALPVYNSSPIYGSAFTNLPLRNYSSGYPKVTNLVTGQRDHSADDLFGRERSSGDRFGERDLE